eukprot:tig00020855_g14695.t1
MPKSKQPRMPKPKAVKMQKPQKPQPKALPATKAPKFKALGPLQRAKAKADLRPRRPKDIAKEASGHSRTGRRRALPLTSSWTRATIPASPGGGGLSLSGGWSQGRSRPEAVSS